MSIIIIRTIMPPLTNTADAGPSAGRRGKRRRGRRYTGAVLGSRPGRARGTPWHTGAGDIDLIDFHPMRYGYELHDVFDQFESPQ